MGNVIGFAFALPLTYFLARGALKKPMIMRLLGLLGLGGTQGFIGWWMVKSGLEKKPDYHISPKVSVYRLFVHLNMAMIIFSLLFWNSMTLLQGPAEKAWTKSNFK